MISNFNNIFIALLFACQFHAFWFSYQQNIVIIQMKNIKVKRLPFFFQNKNETYFFVINKPNIMISTNIMISNISNIFIILLFGYQFHAFQLSYQQKNVTILINQRRGAYQRATLTSVWVSKGAALIRGQRLFEAQHLLEQIQHLRITFFKQVYFVICVNGKYIT